jgi:hypothetical protein
MNKNRILKAATALGMIAALSLAFLPGTTLSKYTAQAIGTATAQVAKWRPFEDYHDKSKDRMDDDGSGEAVWLVFDKNAAEEQATLYLTNQSEVTAHYLLEATVQEVAGETSGPVVANFLEDIMTSIANSHQEYDPDDGIVLQYGATEELAVTIPAVSFIGLEIIARSVQVD